MDTYMVACLDRGILLSNKKEFTADGCIIMGTSLQGYRQKKNPDIKSELYYSINKMFWQSQNGKYKNKTEQW